MSRNQEQSREIADSVKYSNNPKEKSFMGDYLRGNIQLNSNGSVKLTEQGVEKLKSETTDQQGYLGRVKSGDVKYTIDKNSKHDVEFLEFEKHMVSRLSE